MADEPETVDYVGIGLAFLTFLLENAPDMFDAFRGGDQDRVAAWARTRENAIRARVDFELARGGG